MKRRKRSRDSTMMMIIIIIIIIIKVRDIVTNEKLKTKSIRKPFWNISLSKLVEHCFGKSLDKTEQCSNWERRPLNISQIEYGAMDAYILVKIFHHVVDLTNNRSLSFIETMLI